MSSLTTTARKKCYDFYSYRLKPVNRNEPVTKEDFELKFIHS